MVCSLTSTVGSIFRSLTWSSVLLAGLLLGFALRVYCLGCQSLWFDESFSAWVAHLGFAAGLEYIIRWDAHPPLYYWVLTAWRSVVGVSEFSMRFPSVVFGMLLLPVIYQTGRKLEGRWVGSIALLFAAVAPILVYHSQQARMYAMATLFCALATYWFVAALRGTGDWRAIVLWAVCSALALLTLYLSALVIIGQVSLVVWACWRDWRAGRAQSLRSIKRAVVMSSLVAIALFPWLPAFVQQSAASAPGAWRTLVPLPEMLVRSVGSFTLGQTADGRDGVWVWIAGFAGVLLFLPGLLWWGRNGPRGRARSAGLLSIAGLCAAGVGIPLLLIVLGSYVRPIFTPRYLVISYPPIAVALAYGLLRIRELRTGIALLLLVAFVGGGTLSLHNLYYSDHYALDDFRGAVRDLEQGLGPGDTVVVSSGATFPGVAAYLTLPIYWRGPLQSYASEALPRQPDRERGITVVQVGTIGQGQALTTPEDHPLTVDEALSGLRTIAATSDRVWFFRAYDTLNDGQMLLRNWLGSEMRMADERYYRGGSLQLFLFVPKDPAVLLPRVRQTTDLQYANGTSLRGFSMRSDEVVPGTPLFVTLYWTTDRPISGDYQISVQLVSRTGQKVAQADGPPLNGHYQTSGWHAGDLIPEARRIDIPFGTLPGQYRLLVSLYDTESLNRVPLNDGADVGTAGSLVVRPSQANMRDITVTGDVSWENGLGMLGTRIDRPLATVGNVVVTLYWHAETKLTTDYTVFVHLVDENGRLRAQSDSEPLSGNFPTSLWTPGDVIADTHTLEVPPDPGPGEYHIVAGVYDRNTGQRLTTLDRRDAIQVGSLRSE